MEINIQCKGIDESKLKVNVDFNHQSSVNITIQTNDLEIIDSIVETKSADVNGIQTIENDSGNDQKLDSIYQSLFTFIVSHYTAGAVFVFATFYLYQDYTKNISQMVFAGNQNIIVGFYLMCLMMGMAILLYAFLIYNLYIKALIRDTRFQKTKFLFVIYGVCFWAIILAPVFFALLTLPKH